MVGTESKKVRKNLDKMYETRRLIKIKKTIAELKKDRKHKIQVQSVKN